MKLPKLFNSTPTGKKITSILAYSRKIMKQHERNHASLNLNRKMNKPGGDDIAPILVHTNAIPENCTAGAWCLLPKIAKIATTSKHSHIQVSSVKQVAVVVVAEDYCQLE